jgi:hypothetical protein
MTNPTRAIIRDGRKCKMVPGALPRADLWLPFQGDRELRNIKTRAPG